MASSKNSPGPHDRRPLADGTIPPRKHCKALNRFGKPCKRWATSGSGLCRFHLNVESVQTPDPAPSDVVRAGISTGVVKKARAAGEKAAPKSNYWQSRTDQVVTRQAKDALTRLRIPLPPGERVDPKMVLLDSVNSSWRQRQVWEAMLAAIPDEDWAHVGEVPIAGIPSSTIGARIETIQKHLTEATKIASRISKLAIDAGIEERLVRIAEEQSALIADTVRAGLIAGVAALAKEGLISPAAEKAAIEAALGAAGSHLRQLAAGINPDGSPLTTDDPDKALIEGSFKEV